MTIDARAAVAVRNLCKVFDGVVAVGGISFDVMPGETVGLLGGNGAGKTTTIAMILGLLTPSSGTATVFGADMSTQRARALPLMNFSSPYVELPKRLTVRENLLVYGRLYDVPDLRMRLQSLAQDLDIEPFLDRALGTLSAGQTTRVSLAKALLNEPKLLLLDEPTASLDPDTGDRIRGYLEDWQARSGGAIVLASHNMAEVERLCVRVFMMQKGEIVGSGTPHDLIAEYGRENLEQVFLDIARGETAA
jgi:ABC-2 type transport system ATP-binding protein